MDVALFTFFNQTLTHPLLDIFFIAITRIGEMPWIIAPFWLALLIFGGTKWRRLGILAVLVLIFSENLSSSLLKPLFERPRPFETVDHARLLLVALNHVGLYSFPSSHATNMACLSGFFFVPVGKKWIRSSLVLLVAVICYSRVYAGVHYPSDVLVGAVLGGALGIGIYTLYITFMTGQKKTAHP